MIGKITDDFEAKLLKHIKEMGVFYPEKQKPEILKRLNQTMCNIDMAVKNIQTTKTINYTQKT